MSWIEIYELNEARKYRGGYDPAQHREPAPEYYRTASAREAKSGEDSKGLTHNSDFDDRGNLMHLDSLKGKLMRIDDKEAGELEADLAHAKSKRKTADGWHFQSNGYLTPGVPRAEAGMKKLQAKIAARKKLGESTSWMEMYLLAEDRRDLFQRKTAAALHAGGAINNPVYSDATRELATKLSSKLTDDSLQAGRNDWQTAKKTGRMDRIDWNPNYERTRSAEQARTGNRTLKGFNVRGPLPKPAQHRVSGTGAYKANIDGEGTGGKREPVGDNPRKVDLYQRMREAALNAQGRRIKSERPDPERAQASRLAVKYDNKAAEARWDKSGGKREPVGKMDLPHIGGDNPHKEEDLVSDPEISPKELLPEPGSEPKQAAPAPQAPEGHKEGQPWPSEDCIERMKKRHGGARTQLMLQKYQEKLDKQAAKGEEH
jgi:hypothetical protein